MAKKKIEVEEVSKVEKMRHSASHVLAQAVLRLFPETKLGIGPAIDNGFYYDFEFISPIEEADLPRIEKEMKKIIKEDLPLTQKLLKRKEAQDLLEGKEQKYKLELLEDIPDKQISFYYSGKEDFVDLCRGPHVESTGKIGAIKLQSIAGAYWRGDEKQPMLTRIYGLAFETEKELENHLNLILEAEKRDHRRLGVELDLYHIDEQVGAGLPLWHPKGALLWRIIDEFWHKEHLKNGYKLVKSPHIAFKKLWEISGHWDFYNSGMYPPIEVGQSLEEAQKKEKVKTSEQFLLKPMNCPFHVAIYQDRGRSYKELPMRLAECGTVYRYEKKGVLSGLTRVRGFTQDDAHIICSKDQVEDELKLVVDFILHMLGAFGFPKDSISIYLSVRGKSSKEKYAGDDEGWKYTEEVLEKVAKDKDLDFTKVEGEAAFYGPKLDFKLKDSLGREWQCSTLQFDFNLPEKFNMEFTNSKGEKERPYMLHRALLGSFERFIGLLIENYGGAFPLWLSPVQVVIVPIADRHNDYAKKVEKELLEKEIRVEVDNRGETLQSKIRDHELDKTPYVAIVGDKEIGTKTVSIRSRSNKEQGLMKIPEFVEKLQAEIKTKGK